MSSDRHPAAGSWRRGVLVCLTLLIAPAAAIGQEQAGSITLDGPSPPVPPATVNRDAEGRATIRAVRLDQPLRIDGALDESVYRDVAPVTGFTQIEPAPGSPATDRTEF